MIEAWIRYKESTDRGGREGELWNLILDLAFASSLHHHHRRCVSFVSIHRCLFSFLFFSFLFFSSLLFSSLLFSSLLFSPLSLDIDSSLSLFLVSPRLIAVSFPCFSSSHPCLFSLFLLDSSLSLFLVSPRLIPVCFPAFLSADRPSGSDPASAPCMAAADEDTDLWTAQSLFGDDAIGGAGLGGIGIGDEDAAVSSLGGGGSGGGGGHDDHYFSGLYATSAAPAAIEAGPALLPPPPPPRAANGGGHVGLDNQVRAAGRGVGFGFVSFSFPERKKERKRKKKKEKEKPPPPPPPAPPPSTRCTASDMRCVLPWGSGSSRLQRERDMIGPPFPEQQQQQQQQRKRRPLDPSVSAPVSASARRA